MRTLSTRFAIATLAIVIVSTASGRAQSRGTDSVAASAAFDAVYARLSDAYRRRDAAAASQLYHQDAYYLAPGSPLLRGRASIARQFERILGRTPSPAGGGPRIAFQISSRAVAADLGFDVGQYAFDGGPPSGKFIVLWRRGADHQWRLWADGYSGLEAAPSAAASPPVVAIDSAPGLALTQTQLAEYVGPLRAIHPAMTSPPEVGILLVDGKLRLSGLSSEHLLLVPEAPDVFRVIDPNFPVGMVVRAHRTAGRIVSVVAASPSPGVPVFVFLK